MGSRVDTFNGTDREYISYLEGQVFTLRQRLSAGPGLVNGTNPTRATGEPRLPPPLQQPRSDIDVTSEHTAKRPRKQGPRWMQSAKILVAQTPTAEDWCESLQKQGIYDIMTSGNAVSCLLDSQLEHRFPTRVMNLEGDPREGVGRNTLTYLKDYAKTTAMRATVASTALALANFQKFLVLSACCVLAEGDTPIASVLDIVRTCVGEDSSDDYCRRTLTVGKYLNALIDELSIHGWGFRSSELLLLWNRAPSYYYHLASSRTSSLDYLKVHLCAEEFSSLALQGTTWTQLFVPSLVYYMLGQQITVERISLILGYQNAHFLASRKNAWRIGPAGVQVDGPRTASGRRESLIE